MVILIKFYVPIFSVAKWKTQGNMHYKYTTMTLNYCLGLQWGRFILQTQNMLNRYLTLFLDVSDPPYIVTMTLNFYNYLNNNKDNLNLSRLH